MKHPPKLFRRATFLTLSLVAIKTLALYPVSAEELTAEQYYKRGSQGIVDSQNAAATEDFDRTLQKDPQFWKAYAARSASRYNCGDYHGALKDIDVAIAHLPPKQSLTTHRELVVKAIANKNVQVQNRENLLMAQQMLLNAQLGINYGTPASLILMNARRRAGLNPMTGLPIGTSFVPVSNGARAGNADPTGPSSISSRLEAMNPGAYLPPVKSAPHQADSQPTIASTYVQPTASLNVHRTRSVNVQPAESSNVQAAAAAKVQEVTAPSTNNEGMTAQQYFDRACGKGKSMDFTGALQDYDEAIRLDPQHGPAYANRGSLRFNSGDHKGALEDFNKAVTLMPDNKGVKELRDVIIKAIGQ